jgi:hypothetical protein
MTRRNHVPILELHGLGTLGPELAAYNNLGKQKGLSIYRFYIKNEL